MAELNLEIIDDTEIDMTVDSAVEVLPSAYLKSATVSGNTLTLKKQDDTEVPYTPEMQGGEWGEITGDISDQTDLQEALDEKADSDDVYTKTQTDTAIANHHDSTKQDVISDLATIRSGASAGATAYQKPNTGIPKTDLASDVQASLGKADSALQEHQSLSGYATESWVEGKGYLTEHQSLSAYRTSSAQDTIDEAMQDDIDAIEAKIPNEASSSNQLADKSFVNSSIATSTANYISNSGEPFTSVEQLRAYTGTVTNNDYAFVTGTDTSGNTYFDRYKATVSGTTVTWAKEYRLNNSSFTAQQWAAINSGITAVLTAEITANTNARHTHSNKSVLDGITSALVTAWNNAVTWITTNGTNLLSHLTNTSNPHSVTKAQVGLGNVDNTADADKPISTAAQTALNAKMATPTTAQTLIADTDNMVGVGFKITWANIKAVLKTYFDTLYTKVIESTVSGWGFTKNTGTVTSVSVKMNGATKGTVTASGEIDLGTVLTEHQSLSAYRTSAAQDTIDSGKQAKKIDATATLAAASWSNSTITVSVSGVTASNTVFVSPAPASVNDWATAKVYCSAQGAGTLTFTCTTTPTADLTANVVIFN